jgi:hypothetical protein
LRQHLRRELERLSRVLLTGADLTMRQPAGHRASLVILAVLVAGCGAVRGPAGPPAGCATANDTLIVPGCRVGPYTIGMTEADLLTHFGRPSRSWPNQGGGNVSDYEYEGGGVYLRVVAGTVLWVKALSPRFATARGLRVGASALEMKVAFGAPLWVNSVPYPDFTDLTYCFQDASGSIATVDVRNDNVRAIAAGGCTP